MNILPLLLVLAQQQSPLNGFDTYVAQAVKDWRVPGLAIVVVKDDSIAFIKGYGVRELGKPDHQRPGFLGKSLRANVRVLGQ